jgi:fructose-1,6-bisphosphatase/sedoheptulose 1,7-bisphosphatase-like protein
MERELSREFLRVVEESAIAAARTMGQGDRKFADQAAVEAMRKAMDSIPMNGTIVIGEGERDEARCSISLKRVESRSPPQTVSMKSFVRWTL